MSVRTWQPPQGYYWKVVVDPTRTGEDPGMFYGAHFRWTDIVLPDNRERIPCPWPSGTVFENVRTGERIIIRRGRVVREKEGSHGTADAAPRAHRAGRASG